MFSALIALSVGGIFPLAVFIYCLVKKKDLKAFLLGSLTFIIFQVMLRIPLLQLLSKNSIEFNLFQSLHPILYILFLAITAGIFEEVGRYLIMKYCLKKKDSFQTAIFFGLGHGGIEAFLFLGMNAIIYFFTTSSDIMNGDFLWGSLERIIAIILHVELSIIVMKSVKEHNNKYLWLAIILHGMIDSIITIVQFFGGQSLILTESIFGVSVVCLGFYSMKLKKE
ncbi:YhfC family glutamic-type intramembrane protease [Enterococcus crotali]|uniref:YhfC family glutamic-type intramembrane protease n=1 Tax=Enterococcus crotali TaxID=1453587 RepID=UPI0004725724|nr:YhfC family glutamic-type intramembrane protease [Enterococcus crotali]